MKSNLEKLISTEFDIQAVQAERVVFTDGTRVRFKQAHDLVTDYLNDYLSEKEQLEFFKLKDNEKISTVVKILRKVCKEQEDLRLKDSADFDYSNLTILVEKSEQELFYVFDDEAQGISEISHWALKQMITPKQYGTIEKKLCRKVYEPFNAEENYNDITVGNTNMVRVNNYQHPSWRSSLKVVSPSSMPESARMFFEHLFPCPDARDYVLSWLYDALMSRHGSEFILVLNGPTGTGKTIFATNLMIALFGEANWGAAPKNLFSSAFNSVLEDKRIIYIDEAKINESDYNTVKLYANKKLNIEKKGVDANNTTDLYYSMVLSNNKMGAIYVDPDDRRYSIVPTANNKLLEEWSSEEVEDFIQDLKDPAFVQQIGNYILSRHDEDFVLEQYKGEKFYQFVVRHLSSWQKIVLNKIVKEGADGEEEIELSRLQSAIINNKNIKYDVQEDTIVEFLDSYKHLGLHRLGKIVGAENERVVKIDPQFIEDEEEEELL